MVELDMISDEALDKQLNETTASCLSLIGDLRPVKDKAESFRVERDLQQPGLPPVESCPRETSDSPGVHSVEEEMRSRLGILEKRLPEHTSRKLMMKKVIKPAQETRAKEIGDLRKRREDVLSSLRKQELSLRTGVYYIQEKVKFGHMWITVDYLGRKQEPERPPGLETLKELALSFHSAIMSFWNSLKAL